MSNVGPQAVSMRDLIKLGPQMLGAMAQGQQPSIAPSYMVIAALKAVTDLQRGQQAPEQQQTVKDQVVAQAAPSMQAGIGAMAPQGVQGFSQGGLVGTAAINEDIANYFRERFGPGWDRIKEETRRGLAGRRRTADEMNYGNEGRNYPAPATAATGATSAADTPLPVPPPAMSVVPENAPAETGQGGTGSNRASASSTSRSGIGGMGRNPMREYSKESLSRRALSKMPDLDAPKNEFLDRALEKFSAPDEKRLAELRDAERNAGLGAFARGIMKGRGFGGAFGPAVADMFDAKTERADKRREYEDAREKIALELGLKKGTSEYNRFMDNMRFKQTERDAQFDTDAANLRRSDEQTTEINRRNIEIMKAELQAETNRLAAEIRQDGMDDRRLERLLTVQRQAFEAAQRVAQNEMQGNPALMANPQRENILEQMREREYRRLFPPQLDGLLQQYMGVPGGAAPAAGTDGAPVRGRFPG
jgi:hypothetical protein